MTTSLIAAAILLGGVIFFHEFGHYLIAKLFNVKVEIFSLGFGKKILRKQWGETEYCLSIIPLGGYVKLSGDDPTKPIPVENVARAFSTQTLYKRWLIVAAGPIANLLLGFILYLFIFGIGQPVRSTRVGQVSPQSPAWKAGLRAKDKIQSVDEKAVDTWDEFEKLLRPNVGAQVSLVVERENNPFKLKVPVDKVRTRNPYGEEEEVGGIEGISPFPSAAQIGVSNPKSAAYAAGLRTGDVIALFNQVDIRTFDDLETLASVAKVNPVTSISIRRKNDKKEENLKFTTTFPSPTELETRTPSLYLERLGIYSPELFVKRVSSESSADKAGLLPGDRLVSLNGEKVQYFDAVVDLVQRIGSQGLEVALIIEREGVQRTLKVKPASTTLEDPITGKPTQRYLIGFERDGMYLDAEYTKYQITNPIHLVARAAEEAVIQSWRMFVSIGKLITGKVSVKNLGGPVLIASLAGKSFEAGVVRFLETMSLISLNLFLLNLFPIPILDGGHLLFFTIEAIKGKPVSLRTMEVASQVGMFLILGLVGLTLFNDISRIVFH